MNSLKNRLLKNEQEQVSGNQCLDNIHSENIINKSIIKIEICPHLQFGNRAKNKKLFCAEALTFKEEKGKITSVE